MADSESAPWLRRPTAQAVADSASSTTVAVQCGSWSTAVPQLSAEAAAMLAPPVVVSSSPIGPPPPPAAGRRRADLMRFRLNLPSVLSGKHRRTRTG